MLAAVAAGFLVLIPDLSGAVGVDDETAARLKTFLPKTYPKLVAREPVHVVAIGDSLTRGYRYDEFRYSLLKAFPGAFADAMAKEFFYTGGVREIRPEGDNPEKLEPSLGPEITVQSFARNGAEVFYAFAPLTTEAFDLQPDIVMVMFGVNDSRNGVPLGMYAEAFVEIAKIIRARGADPIFIGPSPAFDLNPRHDLGLSRPFTTALREICERAGIFFADAEQLVISQMHRGFGPAPDTAFQDLVKQVLPAYDHGPDIEDLVHLSGEGHELLGRGIAEALFRGRPASRYGATASLRTDGKGGYIVEATVQNLGNMTIEAVLCPLSLEGVAVPAPPAEGEAPDVLVTLEAGASVPIRIPYMPNPRKTASRAGEPDIFSGIEDFVRTSFLVIDKEEARIVDVMATIQPLAVVWGQGNALNLSDRFTVNAEISNTSGVPFAGTYAATWAGQEVGGSFSLEPGARDPIELVFDLPGGGVGLLRDTVELTVSGGGAEYRFQREIEASQNLGLGIGYPLYPLSEYGLGETGDDLLHEDGPAVTMRAQADEDAFYLIFDIAGHELYGTAEVPAVRIRLNLDGRYYKERGSLGYSHRIEISAPAADGDGRVGNIPLGAFGNGYDRPLDATNIQVKTSTLESGARRVAVTVPRAYFYLHEWAIGNANSGLGLRAVVALTDAEDLQSSPKPVPASRTFTRSWGGMGSSNPRSFLQLELTAKPSGRWSVRVY
ncbi:hypothetical protein BH23VER1_BH23VER1_23200 [soil metagenome]